MGGSPQAIGLEVPAEIEHLCAVAPRPLGNHMKSAKGIASLGLLALVASVVPTSVGTAQSPYFTLRICNSSQVRAGMAVAYRVEQESWLVAGWLLVDPGDCLTAGNALKGWIYHYGEENSTRSQKAVWRGDAVQLCVEYPGPFRRQVVEGYQCTENELKSFGSTFVGENVGTYTLNLN
jgi:uncharacterized membrane protein